MYVNNLNQVDDSSSRKRSGDQVRSPGIISPVPKNVAVDWSLENMETDQCLQALLEMISDYRDLPDEGMFFNIFKINSINGIILFYFKYM